MDIENLTLVQGDTFSHIVRWETEPVVFKPITGITAAAPAVVTAVGHNLTAGWRVAAVSVKGMTQINAQSPLPRNKDYYTVAVVDADHVQLAGVNAADFDAYTSGGYLQYNTPASLAGFTARMSIKDVIGGTELLRLDTTTSRIVIDDTAKTIALTVDATTTAALTFTNGVYDLELVSGTGVVTKLLSGAVSVIPEVTST
jgi:hypothetical protein